ncbi:MAG: class I SAM-dependent methyltransferase [Chloroflexi bacterium]|nr:class I SAM-dependent methyltransferase [Chloroflexota bacterium]MDA1146259.1 class I SAM-dependent methyltransferase [Chloroflexota bacterium]
MDDYDEFFTPFSEQVGELVLDAVAPAPGEHCLEIGAGTGALTQLAFHWPDVVAAIDFAPAMIQALQAKLQEHYGAELAEWNVACHVMDAHNLRFEPDWFESVMSNLTLPYLRDPILALREIWRVTAHYGRVATSAITVEGQTALRQPIVAAISSVKSDFVPPPPPPTRLTSPSDLKLALGAVGFRDITTDVQSIDYRIQDAGGYWDRWAFESPTYFNGFGDIDSTTRSAARGAFMAQMEQCRVDGVSTIPVEVVVGRAVKPDSPRRPRGLAALRLVGHPPVLGSNEPERGLPRLKGLL